VYSTFVFFSDKTDYQHCMFIAFGLQISRIYFLIEI